MEFPDLKVFLNIMLRTSLQSREELCGLRKDSFIEKKDEDGNVYMTLSYKEKEERRQGAQSGGLIERDGRMYAQDGADCPVLLLQNYLSKLNNTCNAFFQRPTRVAVPKPGCWYDGVPVGKTVLFAMLPNICMAVGLDKRYTNNSLQVTPATTLTLAGMDGSAIRNKSNVTTSGRDSVRASCNNNLHSSPKKNHIDSIELRKQTVKEADDTQPRLAQGDNHVPEHFATSTKSNTKWAVQIFQGRLWVDACDHIPTFKEYTTICNFICSHS
jgi:hypothetical protein